MSVTTRTEPGSRSPLRSVALPNEHGGWGLTAEPVVLGLLLAPSWAGVCLGLAAVASFLVRTPLKLIAIDVRHRRRIDRTRLAARVAAAELTVVVLLGLVAVLLVGWSWIVPVLLAVPLIAVEWSYDSRGRGRRLVPEVAGAAGIAAVAAAVIVAGGGSSALAAGAWLVLAARAIGSIPFVRVQIMRLRRGIGDAHRSDTWQVAALLVASAAAALDQRLLAGTVAIGMLAVLQMWWVRRPPVPARRLGFTQLGLGVALVVVTTIGVALA